MNKENSFSYKVSESVKDYMMLMKFTLSFTVVFSCVISYLLSPNTQVSNVVKIIELFVAGMLVTGAANAINQAVEKSTDAMMKRTANRPVASGRMSAQHALGFAFITGVLGIVMMWTCFNMESAFLSVFSLFLYAYIYTPLKKVSSIAVLVGAFPGALPCLIGWVAGFSHGGDNSWAGGWILFLIQFLWQFPHFWAIAWVAHNDYSKAGFKLLPSEKGPTKKTALQAVIYSVMMVPVGMLAFVGIGSRPINDIGSIAGKISFVIILLCNLGMVVQSIRLYINMDVKSARRVMFSSYIYLPIVLLALLFAVNKIY
ncbi:heme o synthase [Arachidicoccus sp.]|uniref:heme o synthase n=1 Tax=Arachidicoccus sp. TaxID=1872624 RepID=UPI003D192777